MLYTFFSNPVSSRKEAAQIHTPFSIFWCAIHSPLVCKHNTVSIPYLLQHILQDSGSMKCSEQKKLFFNSFEQNGGTHFNRTTVLLLIQQSLQQYSGITKLAWPLSFPILLKQTSIWSKWSDHKLQLITLSFYCISKHIEGKCIAVPLGNMESIFSRIISVAPSRERRTTFQSKHLLVSFWSFYMNGNKK